MPFFACQVVVVLLRSDEAMGCDYWHYATHARVDGGFHFFLHANTCEICPCSARFRPCTLRLGGFLQKMRFEYAFSELERLSSAHPSSRLTMW